MLSRQFYFDTFGTILIIIMKTTEKNLMIKIDSHIEYIIRILAKKDKMPFQMKVSELIELGIQEDRRLRFYS